jgi:hypothetical protein
VVRVLARDQTATALREAAAALEAGTDPPDVPGDDPGEKLTHVLLALRIRARVDAGEDALTAYRAEMASVRAVLSNAPR